MLSILAELSRGAATTLTVAFGAWFVAASLGFVLAIARQNRSVLIQVLLDFVVTVLRSIPQLVVLYLIFFGLGGFGLNVGSVPAAILGLGVTDAAFTAEYYRAGFLTVTERQHEAESQETQLDGKGGAGGHPEIPPVGRPQDRPAELGRDAEVD